MLRLQRNKVLCSVLQVRHSHVLKDLHKKFKHQLYAFCKIDVQRQRAMKIQAMAFYGSESFTNDSAIHIKLKL